MSSILAEIVLIVLLLLVNGVFAMAEIAVVSARKTRLRQLADAGEVRARAALGLAESPNRFLSTVQIGITLVGILAGAFGGATIARQISLGLQAVPGVGSYSDAIGLAVVVLCITYLSLVIGELVPKRLGLANPESISMAVAKPMQALSSFAKPLVRVLSASTEVLIKIIGVKPASNVINEEEVKGLMQEGLRAGAFQKIESEMVENILELDQVAVREIMTPRPKIIWLNRNDPHEAIWHKIVVSAHSNYPVYEGNRDNVVGVVSVKSIYANLAANVGVQISDLMVKPLLVPATLKTIRLLETFRQTGTTIALVVDEFGGIVGLVTLRDIMEAIVGDFPSQEERVKPVAQKRPDGSWLVDAMIEIDRLRAILPGVRFGDGSEYQTLAGFIVNHLGHLPREGETVTIDGHVFEVIDMDRHRIDKVLVLPPGIRTDSSAQP